MRIGITSYLALIVGIVSLCYAMWLHQHTEALVQRALQQREAALVKALEPTVHDFCEGFGIAESSIPKSPSTLEELFRPLEKAHELVAPRANPKTNQTSSADGSHR